MDWRWWAVWGAVMVVSAVYGLFKAHQDKNRILAEMERQRREGITHPDMTFQEACQIQARVQNGQGPTYDDFEKMASHYLLSEKTGKKADVAVFASNELFAGNGQEQSNYTITLGPDAYQGMILLDVCQRAAKGMEKDLEDDQRARRTFGYKPEKDLTYFPQAIAYYYGVCDTIVKMEFKGTMRINTLTAHLLMMQLMVVRSRLEAAPDCPEKAANLKELAAIMGQLPVNEGRGNGMAYWQFFE